MTDDHAGHHHGHQHDQGWRAALRYLRFLPRMLNSDANRYVVATLDPSAGERAVDLGAGMGPASMLAVRRGAKVTAVEPTPFMRRVLALRRLTSRGRKRLTIVDGIAERTGLDDGSADVVWAVNSVHHWHDLDAAAAEIARVLAPGGRVLLVDEDFEHPRHPFNRPRRWPLSILAERDQDRREEHGLDPVGALDMAAALGAAGLDDVESGESMAGEVPIKQASGVKGRPTLRSA